MTVYVLWSAVRREGLCVHEQSAGFFPVRYVQGQNNSGGTGCVVKGISMGGMGGGRGSQDRCVARRRLEDDASVTSEVDIGSALDPAVVERECRAICAKAGGYAARPGGCTDDEADDANAVRGNCILAEENLSPVVRVLVEGTSGEGSEQERDGDLVPRFGFDDAFGVHGQALVGRCVGCGKRCLYILGPAGGEDKLAEVEVERAGASEAAGGFRLGDCSHKRCAFGHGDGVVGVVDRLGHRGVDGLALFGRCRT